MNIDDRFDYSDDLELVEIAEDEKQRASGAEDLDVLAAVNYLPRDIAYNFYLLGIFEQEAKKRELIQPTPEILITERTDDWLAERRSQIRAEISALTRKEEELKAEREFIDQEFTRRFAERGTSGTRTSNYTVSMKEDDLYPEIDDRTAFEEYVLETKRLHLLQKRLSMSAIKEELAAMAQERAAYIKELEAADYSPAVCKRILQEQGDYSDYKFELIQRSGGLKQEVLRQLEERFTIPGINIVTKNTINQVKR